MNPGVTTQWQIAIKVAVLKVAEGNRLYLEYPAKIREKRAPFD